MIRMIAGTFGLPVDGIVVAKTRASGPFEASPEQEARLVKLGIAEYVDAQPIPEEAPEEDESIDFDALTVKELRALAVEKGIEVPANAKKNDIILLFLEPKEAEEDEEVPVFDPAEAVE